MGGMVVGRRGVIAGGVGLLAGASARPTVAADRPIDVLVIGGGLAGLIAARDLAKDGHRVLMLEARPRLGGRVAWDQLAGQAVDSGGTWFHWHQAAIWREVQCYELEVVERPVADRYFIGVGGAFRAMTPEELDGRLRRGLAAFWGDPALQAALATPFAVQASGDRLAALDRMSVEDRLRAIRLDPVDDSALRAIFSDFGRPLDQVSLAWAMQRMANGLWTYESFMALFAVYRLRGTMRALCEAIRADGGFDLRLDAPVTQVVQGAGGVLVRTADGTAFAARAAVVATPVEAWRAIRFSPELPADHRQAAAEGMAAPRLCNFILHVRGLPGVVNSFAPAGIEPFEFTFTHSTIDDGQLLSAYAMEGAIGVRDGAARLETALRRFVPEARLAGFVGHDWGREPFSLGGSGSLKLGQMARFVDRLDRPIGRLCFAGADFAPQFAGFLTGAIESGARAARRIGGILGRG
ncbi:Amine oxidase (flavin-containing) [Rhizorhabdus wittichii RW1]|uniref:Amine oxidase (Flavin-containing) n=1 Tax=Rhizorhabdus wittichii (strain DSM 6014 / CCUG 31198 / JCM 15750 / NBRC 105917 / EY 4224 / RW1) TaxID=392499 RepID=A0A9J9HEZ4_RHIWR|nr:Amine oxidase (flavin-containing) [Rhizorhabdus wittichii RW1]